MIPAAAAADITIDGGFPIRGYMTEKHNKSEPIKTHVLQPVERREDSRGAGQQAKDKDRFSKRYPIRKHEGSASRRFYGKGPKQSLAEKLVKTFTSLISRGIKTIIPWTLLSTLLFSAGAYYVFGTCFAGHGYPLWYLITAGITLFGFYALFGLIYGMAMGLLYTIKSFSEAFGSLIRETINRIKNSIESKIDNIADTLSRNEVSRVVKQTFDELSKNIRKYAAKTAAGITALAVLGGVIFICRKVLLSSLSKIKNKADFFAIMSAKAALVAAIILNLTFFAKLAIAAGYLIGIIMLAGQAVIILLLK